MSGIGSPTGHVRNRVGKEGGPPSGTPGVGARIRAARQMADMTQADLAAAVGVSRSAVAQWETDRAGQVGANLAKIADVLRVSAEHLLRGNFPTEGGAAAEDATELALLRLFRVCHGEDRKILLRMAARFARQADRVLAASVRGVDSPSAL
jgi:transcriptional regulator with XRE-family HTH domain